MSCRSIVVAQLPNLKPIAKASNRSWIYKILPDQIQFWDFQEIKVIRKKFDFERGEGGVNFLLVDGETNDDFLRLKALSLLHKSWSLWQIQAILGWNFHDKLLTSTNARLSYFMITAGFGIVQEFRSQKDNGKNNVQIQTDSGGCTLNRLISVSNHF